VRQFTTPFLTAGSFHESTLHIRGAIAGRIFVSQGG
jgi:hypothetical protein